MRFAHVSDIHIRNVKRHDEYRIVFDKLYESLRSENIDRIVCTGDVAHTKTQLSPEYFSLTVDFFHQLAMIAPIDLLPGNHDGNLRNSTRQDALTPVIDVVNAMQPAHNINYYKKSGIYRISDDFAYGAYSCFDEDNWPLEPEKNGLEQAPVMIALYHGGITNSTTDIGWVMRGNTDQVNIFDGYSYAMLGDIHKRQVLDRDGRIRYAGSLIQQNYGETADKGYLIWDIDSADKFDIQFRELEAPNPYMTVELADFDPDDVPTGARLRLVDGASIMSDVKQGIRDELNEKHLRELVFTVKRRPTEVSASEELHEKFYEIDNQDALIKTYLEERYGTLEPALLAQILAFNAKYDGALKDDGTVTARGVKWRIKNFKFSDTLNYGPENEIDFGRLRGLVGLFAANGSGKSNFLESILYTLTNSISKASVKNIDIIRTGQNECVGELTLDVNGVDHVVKRWTERLNPGRPNEWGKTSLEYSVDGLDMTGLQRNDTEKAIRTQFGMIDDLLLTMLSSQFGMLSFIEKGATERKQVISRFMDLDRFKQKYVKAKDDMSEIKRDMRSYKTPEEYDELMHACTTQTRDLRKQLRGLDSEKESYEAAIAGHQEQIAELNRQITPIDPTLIGVSEDSLNGEIAELEDSLGAFDDHLVELREERNSLRYVAGKDSDKLRKTIEESRKQLINQRDTIREAGHLTQRAALLESVPCGDKFPDCRFIADAFSAKQELVSINSAIAAFDDAESLTASIGKAELELDKQARFEHLKLLIDTAMAKKKGVRAAIRLKNIKVAAILNAREAIEENKQLDKQLDELQDELHGAQAYINNAIVSAQRQVSSRIDAVAIDRARKKDQKAEIEKLKADYTALEYYIDAMSKNGVSYFVMKQRLPLLNNEINAILSSIVNFTITLEPDTDDKKVDIYIHDEKKGRRPIELAGGAEKFISSIAMRVAMINVTNLPKTNMFVIDEGFGSLDPEKIDSIQNMFTYLKKVFDVVIIVSHIDLLKDMVDTTLEIIIDDNGASSIEYIGEPDATTIND